MTTHVAREVEVYLYSLYYMYIPTAWLFASVWVMDKTLCSTEKLQGLYLFTQSDTSTEV